MGAMSSPQPAPRPKSAPRPKPRRKKKVRMQETIPEETHKVDDSTFHVTISHVRAVLRVAEPRPVFLSFAFDNYWHAETDVFKAPSVEPSWQFNASTIAGIDDTTPTQHHSKSQPHPASAPHLLPSASFVYNTEFGYRLYRKFLVVKLSERSPFCDVEWGTGVIPLDSIARGCEAVNLSIIAKDGVTCYGNVYCKIKMTNVQNVCAHLTNLKLSDYPEAYKYDVKLIYLEFGLNGFQRGFDKCTEKRSDAEPRFSAQPALKWSTNLHDMLVSSTAHAPSLKIFFSVHCQVARNRTEEIGVGALPVRMLFSKVVDGWMDLPTKFMVPLANYKGFIRGKILLRDIPQFSQLSGSDLTNVDGVIMPNNVDLSCRKLLPWLKLPRSMEPKPNKIRCATRADFTNSSDNDISLMGTEVDRFGLNDETNHHALSSEQAKAGMDNGHTYSPVTEPASDSGFDSSLGGASSPIKGNLTTNEVVPSLQAGHKEKGQQQRQNATAAGNSDGYRGIKPLVYDSGQNGNDGVPTKVTMNMCSNLENRLLSHVEQIRQIGALREANKKPDSEQWQALSDLKFSVVGRNEGRQRQCSDGSGCSGNGTSGFSDGEFRGNVLKSGKSVGSAGTTDGGVGIGSLVMSDDGYATGSLTTTEGALTTSQKSNIDPQFGDRYDRDVDDRILGVDGVRDCERGSGDFEEGDEWEAILDTSSSRYYFAHRITRESLWLPPGWERMEDEDGQQYFVDHGLRTTQRLFPAAKARAYRESVYVGSAFVQDEGL